MQRIVVIGAGGFGRETLDVIEAINTAATEPVFDLIGVVDDNPSELSRERLAARGIAILGGVDDWVSQNEAMAFVIGIGNPLARAAVAARISDKGFVAVALVHPNAVVGSMCAISAGAVICSGSQISTNVVLGHHVHVNPNATIGHDAVLEQFVSVNPGAIVSGEVVIGEQSLVGAGAVILQGLRVGQRSVIAASACVVSQVLDDTTVKGIPAR